MRILIKFINIIDTISEKTGLAVSVLMPAMVLVLAYEVASRYIFNRPTIWAYDTAIFMFGYTGLLGGAFVLRTRDHINVDVFYARLSPRRKAFLDVVSGFIVFFFLALVVVYGWDIAADAIANGEATATEWGPPIGHFKLMVPIGGGLLLLQGIANWIRSLYLLITNRELES